MSSLYIPNEILYEICNKLDEDGDCRTLFSCALASAAFALPALRALYRVVPRGGVLDDPLTSFAHANTVGDELPREDPCQEYISLWRSVLRSTQGTTYLPYHSFIRTYDGHTLYTLLDRRHFDETRRKLFVGDLAEFTGHNSTAVNRLTIPEFMCLYSYILKKTTKAVLEKTHNLEQVNASMGTQDLKGLFPQLPMLKLLWMGRADTLPGIHLGRECPRLRSLRIDECEDYPSAADAGKELAEVYMPKAILSAARLVDFTVDSAPSIDKETFRALAHHASSLTSLKLSGLSQSAVPSLPTLDACVALEELTLTCNQSAPEIFSKINAPVPQLVKWLKSCPRLKRLSLGGIKESFAIAHEVLKTRTLSLKSLSLSQLDKISDDDLRDICEQLLHHPMLEELELHGDGEGIEFSEFQILMETLEGLPKLRRLHLDFMNEDFADDAALELLVAVPQLEVLILDSSNISSQAWFEFSNLRNLKMLQLNDFTDWSLELIEEFIENFCPIQNRGLVLCFAEVELELDFSYEEVRELGDLIKSHLGGRLVLRQRDQGDTDYWDEEEDYDDELEEMDDEDFDMPDFEPEDYSPGLPHVS